MAERDELISDLAALIVAVLSQMEAAAWVRIVALASRLGVGEDDDQGAVEAALRRALAFDPVGLAEIAAMTGDSTANLNYLMNLAEAPAPVRLARMKVWRRSEVTGYLGRIAYRGPDGRRPYGSAAYLGDRDDDGEPGGEGD